MKIRLERIESEDERTSDQLVTGETVEHEVTLDVDGSSRKFRVYLRADVRPTWDASMLHGDQLLEELLRFQPRALATLYRAVGKHRAGAPPALPLVLVDDDADRVPADAPSA